MGRPTPSCFFSRSAPHPARLCASLPHHLCVPPSLGVASAALVAHLSDPKRGPASSLERFELPGCHAHPHHCASGSTRGCQSPPVPVCAPLPHIPCAPVSLGGAASPPRDGQVEYRGTTLIRKRPPPWTTIGPSAQGFCRLLGRDVFFMSEVPLY